MGCPLWGRTESDSRESSLLFRLERGPGIALQAMQEKKALSSRGWGHLRGFLELRHPWGFSPEARRGSQGASRAVPGKSCLHARGEKERVIVLESWEGTRDESWTVKKAERRRIEAFKLWCWRRLLRVPWTARRSNQSILKEISPGISSEGMMLRAWRPDFPGAAREAP